MEHIENINRLFYKYYVENPNLESYEAPRIHLSTGKLIACDPLVTKEMPPFEAVFPRGDFQVNIHKERVSNCIAYVEIAFSTKLVDRWEMATIKGQEVKSLKEGEVFGYPVESGMGCFMDVETQEDLNILEKKLFERKGDDFMGIYEEFFHDHFFDENGAIDQFASLKPNEDKPNNIIAFETGYGEGFYASYIGYDSENEPVKIVTEFIEINIS